MTVKKSSMVLTFEHQTGAHIPLDLGDYEEILVDDLDILPTKMPSQPTPEEKT